MPSVHPEERTSFGADDRSEMCQEQTLSLFQ
jgi:hypothetical protein